MSVSALLGKQKENEEEKEEGSVSSIQTASLKSWAADEVRLNSSRWPEKD